LYPTNRNKERHMDNYKTVCTTVYILCSLGKSVQLRITECTNNTRYGFVNSFKIAQLERKVRKYVKNTSAQYRLNYIYKEYTTRTQAT
jgi:hypothetical protein